MGAGGGTGGAAEGNAVLSQTGDGRTGKGPGAGTDIPAGRRPLYIARPPAGSQAGLTYFHSDAKDYAYRKGINAQWQALNHENNGYRWGRDGNFTSQALIAGNINDRWAVSLTPRFSYDKDQHGGASLEEAYVRSRIGIVHVTAGKEALSWGEGMTGNLALGNNMKPLTMVRFDTGDNIKNKWMRFIFGNSHIFYARLDGNRADTAASQGLTDYNHPGLLGMRSDFQLEKCDHRAGPDFSAGRPWKRA